jgi:hypothetical protein
MHSVPRNGKETAVCVFCKGAYQEVQYVQKQLKNVLAGALLCSEL